MKTTKLFFLFLFFFTVCACNNEEDPIVCPSMEMMKGMVYVELYPDELVTFELINAVELEIDLFQVGYYDVPLFNLADLDLEEVIKEIHQENPYLYFSGGDWGYYVHFLPAIQEKENQEKWKLFKEKYQLTFLEDVFLNLWYKVPVDSEKEWIDKLNDFPNVMKADYVYGL